MGLKVDHNNAGSTPLKPGWYEVFPTVFDATTAKSSGNKMAVFNYVVRDDVEQPGQKQIIRFDNFVEMDTALWRMNAASKAANMDDGVEYDDIYAWAKAFQGRPVKVKIKENDRGFPEVTSFDTSEAGGFLKPEDIEKYKANKGVSEAPKKNESAPIEIEDDDLPF